MEGHPRKRVSVHSVCVRQEKCAEKGRQKVHRAGQHLTAFIGGMAPEMYIRRPCTGFLNGPVLYFQTPPFCIYGWPHYAIRDGPAQQFTMPPLWIPARFKTAERSLYQCTRLAPLYGTSLSRSGNSLRLLPNGFHPFTAAHQRLLSIGFGLRQYVKSRFLSIRSCQVGSASPSAC